MAEGEGATVEVPQVGRVPKTAVVATVAVAAGILGYAWWKHRQAPSVPFDPNAIDPATGQSYAAEAAGGVSTFQPAPTGDGTVTVGAPTTTLGDWTTHAIELLQSVNVAPDSAAEALAKWLNHQGLTASQKAIVMEARALANDPPISPIPPMLDALPTPAPGPKPKPVPSPGPPVDPGPHGGPPPGDRTYRVVSGDNLWSLESRFGLSHGTLYARNAAAIEADARSHGHASSESGHWIFPGLILHY
jgi:hypothetical protein